MADHTNDHTVYVDRKVVDRERPITSTPLAFIVGGLVVAVVLLLLLFSGFGFEGAESTAPAVNVETPAGSGDVAPLVPADGADPAVPEAVAPVGDAAPATDAN